MRYRIECSDRACCILVGSRTDLLKQLQLLPKETITDIRKIYKNGIFDSAMDIYKQYLK